MASGRRKWTWRLLLLAAFTAYAVLLASGLAPNPLPGFWDWVNRERPIAPDLVWQERLAARPAAAAVAGDVIAVNAGGRAEIRERSSGQLRGPADQPDWPAQWVVVAGEGASQVVVTSERGSRGYEIREPATGAVRHVDEEAVAVWGFRDALLDLRCDRRACQLRQFRPHGGEPLWILDLPGRRVGMLGANPPLAGAASPEPTRIHPAAAGPESMPRVLGFPVETRGSRDAVAVVDLVGARVLRVLEPASGEKLMVVGDRVVGSVVTSHHGVCRSTATGYDPVTGTEVWGPRPYFLWTNGLGCEQRDPPLHAGAAVSAVGTEGEPLVIDAYDGRVLWSGEPDQDVVALTERYAVVRGPGGVLSGVVLGAGQVPLWERVAEPDAEVLITACGVLVADRDPSRLYVWDVVTGEVVLSLPTTARVLACAPDGLVLTSGRSIGFASFAGRDGTRPGFGDAEAK